MSKTDDIKKNKKEVGMKIPKNQKEFIELLTANPEIGLGRELPVVSLKDKQEKMVGYATKKVAGITGIFADAVVDIGNYASIKEEELGQSEVLDPSIDYHAKYMREAIEMLQKRGWNVLYPNPNHHSSTSEQGDKLEEIVPISRLTIRQIKNRVFGTCKDVSDAGLGSYWASPFRVAPEVVRIQTIPGIEEDSTIEFTSKRAKKMFHEMGCGNGFLMRAINVDSKPSFIKGRGICNKVGKSIQSFIASLDGTKIVSGIDGYTGVKSTKYSGPTVQNYMVLVVKGQEDLHNKIGSNVSMNVVEKLKLDSHSRDMAKSFFFRYIEDGMDAFTSPRKLAAWLEKTYLELSDNYDNKDVVRIYEDSKNAIARKLAKGLPVSRTQVTELVISMILNSTKVHVDEQLYLAAAYITVVPSRKAVLPYSMFKTLERRMGKERAMIYCHGMLYRQPIDTYLNGINYEMMRPEDSNGLIIDILVTAGIFKVVDGYIFNMYSNEILLPMSARDAQKGDNDDHVFLLPGVHVVETKDVASERDVEEVDGDMISHILSGFEAKRNIGTVSNLYTEKLEKALDAGRLLEDSASKNKLYNDIAMFMGEKLHATTKGVKRILRHAMNIDAINKDFHNKMARNYNDDVVNVLIEKGSNLLNWYRFGRVGRRYPNTNIIKQFNKFKKIVRHAVDNGISHRFYRELADNFTRISIKNPDDCRPLLTRKSVNTWNNYVKTHKDNIKFVDDIRGQLCSMIRIMDEKKEDWTLERKVKVLRYMLTRMVRYNDVITDKAKGIFNIQKLMTSRLFTLGDKAMHRNLLLYMMDVEPVAVVADNMFKKDENGVFTHYPVVIAPVTNSTPPKPTNDKKNKPSKKETKKGGKKESDASIETKALLIAFQNIPLADIISKQTMSKLEKLGIEYAYEIINRDVNELKKIKGITPVMYNHIIDDFKKIHIDLEKRKVNRDFLVEKFKLQHFARIRKGFNYNRPLKDLLRDPAKKSSVKGEDDFTF